MKKLFLLLISLCLTLIPSCADSNSLGKTVFGSQNSNYSENTIQNSSSLDDLQASAYINSEIVSSFSDSSSFSSYEYEEYYQKLVTRPYKLSSYHLFSHYSNIVYESFILNFYVDRTAVAVWTCENEEEETATFSFSLSFSTSDNLYYLHFDAISENNPNCFMFEKGGYWQISKDFSSINYKNVRYGNPVTSDGSPLRIDTSDVAEFTISY